MMGAAAAAILTEITLLIGFTLFIRKGMQLLVKGIIFNSLAFIISYGIYRIALINLPPLIALTLTGILYGIIGIGIDPQIRICFRVYKTKAHSQTCLKQKLFLFKNGKAFAFIYHHFSSVKNAIYSSSN